jgi:transcriptional antiterminator Rof (Rho-off)
MNEQSLIDEWALACLQLDRLKLHLTDGAELSGPLADVLGRPRILSWCHNRMTA